MNFSLDHISTLCKYTGISFTAGAITHGAFSEQRSLITAGIGIAIYLIGGVLEKYAHPDKEHSWTNLLAVGVVASIGLGFFTGGLQHFPDSPERSSWVVPVGFVMSLVALYLMADKSSLAGSGAIRKILTYGILSSLMVIGVSIYAGIYFHNHPIANHHAAPAASEPSKGHDHSTHRH
ncbi:hypothetical protein ICN28_09010 [Polynucleobacter sp. 30F-ANTBAC]|jgi:hypothetical protein|uniref:hypothetical protein n=1 Tax=Polynucleobacter sp. 30F-ANTBAC TaxID=2689095 RepID=UPI001C0B0D13|nr:hypothetical protein [Polynucleobacter sp. 30F-ANTBAC]MBU3600658.1 hypothetical protein [Polynucleobacter sp. 30F-ANTBAC]